MSKPSAAALDAEAGQEWRDLLGADLCALIRDLDTPVTTIEPLAKLDAPGHRSAAFRLELADGRVFKARRAWDAERAEQIAWFMERLADLDFPTVHARRDRALLLEWVDGPVVSTVSDQDWIAAVAGLQGRLHRRPIPDDCPYACRVDPATFAVAIDKSTARLVEAGGITSAEGKVISHLTRQHRPQHAQTGIIHTDLCPANLVIAADGRLRPVDNESLHIGCLDLDLARTWYRWPLQGTRGEEFLDAYGRWRCTASFVEHFPFWFLGVALGSAVYRLGSPSRAWAEPVERLRAFIEASPATRPPDYRDHTRRG